MITIILIDAGLKLVPPSTLGIMSVIKNHNKSKVPVNLANGKIMLVVIHRRLCGAIEMDSSRECVHIFVQSREYVHILGSIFMYRCRGNWTPGRSVWLSLSLDKWIADSNKYKSTVL